MNNVAPDWFKKASVYQINPRTFSEKGTIKAITEELPTLAELGFKVMYLCPIFEEDDSNDENFWSNRQKASKTNNPKNPYRMNNYFTIDCEYGNMEDLREFVSVSHSLNLKVILDLVYFHIGPNAPIIKEHPEFIIRDEKGNAILGEWHFPRLNYESEGLCEYLFCNMVYYVAEIGVDGFRCDVGDNIPLDFWNEGKRRIMAVKSDVVMINEGEKSAYLKVFDANYGWHWHSCLFDLISKSITAGDLIKTHTEYANRYNDALILRDMDNHDTVTDWPYRIEEHYGHDCMELLLATNYTIDGVPMVYCGNELADTKKLSMFANRFHMGAFETTDRSLVNDASLRRKDVIKKLNLLKRDRCALSNGKTEWIENDNPSVLSFTRSYDNESIFFVGNYSDTKTEIKIKQGEILLSNNAESNGETALLNSYGYMIIKE